LLLALQCDGTASVAILAAQVGLIETTRVEGVSSAFSMEQIKYTTALPVTAG
jgi:hypothetical protein